MTTPDPQRPTPQPPTPQRIGPRPLPLHMAMEGWILQASFAGLMNWNSASPSSKPNASLPPDPARVLAAEAAGQSPDTVSLPWHRTLDPVQLIDAVTREAQARLTNFVEGVRAYQSHPFRRTLEPAPAVWQRGVASLRDYGGDGVPVLYVPSLINRGYILDLAEDRSLLRTSANSGLHTYMLDWGAPGAAECAFTSEDYIDGVLIPALEEVKARTGAAPRLVGYCMGGTLATAAAVLRPDLISGLVLLAAPWDFHAESEAARVLLGFARPVLEVMLKAEGQASVDLLQALFATLDPTLVGRKFRSFAARDLSTDQARRFVELEDWLNDGVALAGPLAEEALFIWYGDNAPMRGAWRVRDVIIDPSQIAAPTLALIPSQDRIVPPQSARALAALIPGAQSRDVPFGHIGMMAGGSAPKRIYEPLIAWLKTPA